jgi:hypothetical protein
MKLISGSSREGGNQSQGAVGRVGRDGTNLREDREGWNQSQGAVGRDGTNLREGREGWNQSQGAV